jgi:hypothetical protein
MIKFLETHYDDYILSNEKISLQPKISSIIKKITPTDFNKLNNIILYGPSGVGKYTSSLEIIKKYSPSHLKYEKKLNIVFNKQEYYFKISDIHYEIDMSLLGCNSKLLWHDIYLQIVDIISLKPDKKGIILCKYFNEIQIELLDNFYSYLQSNLSLHIKFILITESLSFLPDNILNSFYILPFQRPSKTLYKNIVNSCLSSSSSPLLLQQQPSTTSSSSSSYNKKLKQHIITTPSATNCDDSCHSSETKNIINNNYENIHNIKNLLCNIDNPIKHTEYICNKIINDFIFSKKGQDFSFLKLREILYDIFIYNLNIGDFIWNIILLLSKKHTFHNTDFTNILFKSYKFFKYYNNNYRPIYHIELYIYYLITIIHKDLK